MDDVQCLIQSLLKGLDQRHISSDIPFSPCAQPVSIHRAMLGQLPVCKEKQSGTVKEFGACVYVEGEYSACVMCRGSGRCQLCSRSDGARNCLTAALEISLEFVQFPHYGFGSQLIASTLILTLWYRHLLLRRLRCHTHTQQVDGREGGREEAVGRKSKITALGF